VGVAVPGRAVTLSRFDPPPLRSLLFVPAHRPGWPEKAVAAGADGVLLDLQDAVPDREKDNARNVAAAAIDRLAGSDRSVLVRVGSPGSTDLDADLDAVVRPGLDAVVLPMVRSPAEVGDVDSKLTGLEAARGIAAGSIALTPLIETAEAARFAYEVASASGRVAYLGGGTGPDGDIARAIGFVWSAAGEETLFLRSWVLLNARAAGVPYPISGIWPMLDDLDGLRRFAAQTRGLGYTGMMAIHPSHVAVINEVFTPSLAQIARWEATVAAVDAASTEGLGAVRLAAAPPGDAGPGDAGRGAAMVDAAHARTARDGLALAARLGLAVSPPRA
jgi:citrate lyase subunit beta / citryl-CoA lyase